VADIATAALVFGGFLLVFCAFGATVEYLIERHDRSRRLRRRISRYGR
jgi:hypothetical protein